MWIIADRYAVTSLMDKAASELAIELAKWRISASAFILQFGKLIRYVYANTISCCQLRQVLASFAVGVGEGVSRLEGWEMLLADMPDFTMDLVRQMTSGQAVKHLVKPGPSRAWSSIFMNY
ncbi:hypothetical protein F4824DRAFT_501007 [Ustulina deusta]|nr:hypothetical protein F4824DRAFT_501007 [Ustulina deusta]